MKQKTFALALSLCLICGLCACGGDGGGGSTTPKAAEPENGIVGSLLDKGNEILTELTPEPEKVHGLIFVDYMGIVSHRIDGAHVVGTHTKDGTPVRSVDPADIGDEVVDYLDNGVVGFEGHGYAIYCLDPDTGEKTKISSFYYPKIGPNYPYATELLRDNNPFIESQPSWGFDSPEPARRYFSDDYSKMACIIWGRDEENAAGKSSCHVGWIDTNSKFFDVTEALGLSSDSYDSRDVLDGFSGKYFGYSRGYRGSDGTYYVPIDDVSPEKIQEGNVHAVGRPYDEDDRLRGHYFPDEVTSWLDDTHAIVNGHGDGYRLCSKIVDVDTRTDMEYIPEYSGDTWIGETRNGVASPDGSKIAFMSDSGVYIIPVNGGDPVRVEVPEILSAMHPSSTPKDYEGWTLIDWQ